MKIILKTQSGTQYTLNTANRSWKRERKPEECNPGWVSSDDFEMNEGTYCQASFKLGERMRLVNEAEPDKYDGHYVVISTPVIGISAEDV